MIQPMCDNYIPYTCLTFALVSSNIETHIAVHQTDNSTLTTGWLISLCLSMHLRSAFLNHDSCSD